MPYHVRKVGDEYCVFKGHRDNPQSKVPGGCHDSRKEALAHMAALYVHVEDASSKEALESLAFGTIKFMHNPNEWAVHALQDFKWFKSSMVYEEKGSTVDRWLAISTAEVWDKQGEMVTTQAMDYDIDRAARTKEFPEMRLFHIRGFKLGMCDFMTRVGKYAVDMGYWYDTPFAQYTKGLVENNEGKWKISRGFYSVEATGLCLKCATDLMVRPVNYILGGWCVGCKTYYSTPYALEQLKHLKTITFDITITDVPAVAETAVSAFTVET